MQYIFSQLVRNRESPEFCRKSHENVDLIENIHELYKSFKEGLAQTRKKAITERQYA